MTSMRQVFAGLVLLCLVSPGTSAYTQSVSDPVDVVLNAVPTPPVAFVGIAPCRLADTRPNGAFPPGPYGPPSMAAQAGRVFQVAGQCGIPATAQAVSANLAVTNTSAAGFISVWPGDAAQPNPLVASQNFAAGQTIANAVLAPLGAGGITVYARVGLDLVIDVNGYFDTVPLPPLSAVISGAGTHYTGTSFVLESLTSGTLQLRSTSNVFKDFGFISPSACVGNGAGGNATMTNPHRFSFGIGETLGASFCAEGSTILVTVVEVPAQLVDAQVTQFRCMRTHGNANICQRAF